jgi:hypothetical protein
MDEFFAMCLQAPWNRAERPNARVMMPVKNGAMRENHDIPTISSTDYARLAGIATSGTRYRRIPPTARLLAGELGRARVVCAPELPDNVVSMHFVVEFTDGITDQARHATLVWSDRRDRNPSSRNRWSGHRCPQGRYSRWRVPCCHPALSGVKGMLLPCSSRRERSKCTEGAQCPRRGTPGDAGPLDPAAARVCFAARIRTSREGPTLPNR